MKDGAMKGEMKGQKGPKPKNDNTKSIIAMFAIIAFAALLVYIYPSKERAVVSISLKFFIEMLEILPAVMILMGLFSVFVSREFVVRYLGKEAGFKSIILAMAMGALPTGPLYIAFPIAAVLLKKGARISSIIVFLSAWSCIKLPQELVELQFLGFRFMIARLSVTIVFVILMGLVIEWIVKEVEGARPQKNL